MLAVAAFLLASSTAQAQYEFQYGGRTIRIDPDRGTVSIPGVYDNTGKKSKRAKEQGKTQDAKVDPQAQPAPAETAPATAAPAAPAAAPPPVAAAPAAPPPPAPPPPAIATTAPDPSTAPPPPPPAPTTETAALPPPPPPQPAPPVQQAAPPPPAPTVAAAPPAPRPPAPAPAAIRDPNSPIGVWLTEEKEGKVRIEQCGPNLCGYSVDAKTNLNGEQVLINMKPGQSLKWSGRIHDPNTGSNYDSTIALKGDTLRVQGCAFGGMFCGGQTWTRVN
jgi:uncharacterized protein (DUF2147 family)